MKDLFMCLLLNLSRFGNITEAIMYPGGEFTKIKIVTANGTYEFTISKEEETDGNS